MEEVASRKELRGLTRLVMGEASVDPLFCLCLVSRCMDLIFEATMCLLDGV